MDGRNEIKSCTKTFIVKMFKNGYSYGNNPTADDALEDYNRCVRQVVSENACKKAVDAVHAPIEFAGKMYKMSEALPREEVIKAGRGIMSDELVNSQMDSWNLGHGFTSKYHDSISVRTALLTKDGTRLWFLSEWDGTGRRTAVSDDGYLWLVEGDGKGNYRAVQERDPPVDKLALESDDYLKSWIFSLDRHYVDGAHIKYEYTEVAEDYVDYCTKCAELELDGYVAFEPYIDAESKEITRVFIKDGE